ncbi:MAG: hypothetical protein AAB873_03145 [Patescibacteria group bacterium]
MNTEELGASVRGNQGRRIEYFQLHNDQPVVFVGEKRDPAKDVVYFNNLVLNFKEKYKDAGLDKIVLLTREKERTHYLREQAKKDLVKIFQMLGILHRETSIKEDEMQNLVNEHTELLNFVGMRKNDNTVVHKGLKPPPFE